jgi:Na+/H+-dicarboxylate symporter
MNPLKWKLHWQIAAALVAAVVFGVVIQAGELEESEFTGGLVGTCEFLGKLFMNALKMIVVPLIVSSIITGIMSLGSKKDFGRIGLKVFGYYSFTGLAAIILGLVLVNTIRPGDVDLETANKILGEAKNHDTSSLASQSPGDMLGVFLRMFPSNIIKAATDNGQLLGLIVFSLFFGFFISKLPDKLAEFQESFWESIQRVMMLITDLIIKFSPIGVFGLVTPIFIRTGFEVFAPLAWFVLTVVLGLAIHVFGVLALLLWFFGKVNPYRHYRAMAPVLLMAFSTSSSSATLPLTMETVEKTAGVSKKTASFTLPLGATVNMDGTALYECVVVIFIAQFYAAQGGVEIGLVTQFSVLILALLTSVGVAGVPSASLVAITVILGVVGLPLEAVGLIWVTDRVLDMCRTSVNVFSDTCGAVIIGKSEGESGIYADAAVDPEVGAEVARPEATRDGSSDGSND